MVTGGQRNDGAVLREVIDDIRVPRVGGGRPRTTPDAVLVDRAYPTKATREYLRSRGTKTVIPREVGSGHRPEEQGLVRRQATGVQR